MCRILPSYRGRFEYGIPPQTLKTMYSPFKKDYCCCTGTVHCRYCIRAGKPAHLTINSKYETILISDKKEPINELENMNTQLRTQQDAISAIKLGKYLVVSVSGNGDWSMSAAPSVHDNNTSARAECARLARLNPGKMYSFIKLAGAELVPANTLSI